MGNVFAKTKAIKARWEVSSFIKQILFVALLMMIFVAGIYYISSKNTAEQETKILNPDQNSLSIRTVKLKSKKKIQKLSFFGTTESIRKITLKAETGGRVKEILVNDGDFVNENDKIVELDLKDRKAILDQANALVKQRQLEYKVSQSLFKAGHKSETDLAATEANLKAALASLLNVQLDIQNIVIRAPFSGYVQEVMVEKGDLIKSGETNIAQIIENDPYLIVGQVPEKLINLIQIGTIAYSKIITGGEYEGLVKFISRVADPVTRTYKVEIEVLNADGKISEGMTSQITIPIALIDAHQISSSSLALDEDGNIGVKTLGKDDFVEFHKIKIIDEDQDGIWVTGLPYEVELITVGQAFLKAGDKAKRGTDG